MSGLVDEKDLLPPGSEEVDLEEEELVELEHTASGSGLSIPQAPPPVGDEGALPRTPHRTIADEASHDTAGASGSEGVPANKKVVHVTFVPEQLPPPVAPIETPALTAAPRQPRKVAFIDDGKLFEGHLTVESRSLKSIIQFLVDRQAEQRIIIEDLQDQMSTMRSKIAKANRNAALRRAAPGEGGGEGGASKNAPSHRKIIESFFTLWGGRPEDVVQLVESFGDPVVTPDQYTQYLLDLPAFKATRREAISAMTSLGVTRKSSSPPPPTRGPKRSSNEADAGGSGAEALELATQAMEYAKNLEEQLRQLQESGAGGPGIDEEARQGIDDLGEYVSRLVKDLEAKNVVGPQRIPERRPAPSGASGGGRQQQQQQAPAPRAAASRERRDGGGGRGREPRDVSRPTGGRPPGSSQAQREPPVERDYGGGGGGGEPACDEIAREEAANSMQRVEELEQSIDKRFMDLHRSMAQLARSVGAPAPPPPPSDGGMGNSRSITDRDASPVRNRSRGRGERSGGRDEEREMEDERGGGRSRNGARPGGQDSRSGGRPGRDRDRDADDNEDRDRGGRGDSRDRDGRGDSRDRGGNRDRREDRLRGGPQGRPYPPQPMGPPQRYGPPGGRGQQQEGSDEYGQPSTYQQAFQDNQYPQQQQQQQQQRGPPPPGHGGAPLGQHPYGAYPPGSAPPSAHGPSAEENVPGSARQRPVRPPRPSRQAAPVQPEVDKQIRDDLTEVQERQAEFEEEMGKRLQAMEDRLRVLGRSVAAPGATPNGPSIDRKAREDASLSMMRIQQLDREVQQLKRLLNARGVDFAAMSGQSTIASTVGPMDRRYSGAGGSFPYHPGDVNEIQDVYDNKVDGIEKEVESRMEDVNRAISLLKGLGAPPPAGVAPAGPVQSSLAALIQAAQQSGIVLPPNFMMDAHNAAALGLADADTAAADASAAVAGTGGDAHGSTAAAEPQGSPGSNSGPVGYTPNKNVLVLNSQDFGSLRSGDVPATDAHPEPRQLLRSDLTGQQQQHQPMRPTSAHDAFFEGILYRSKGDSVPPGQAVSRLRSPTSRTFGSRLVERTPSLNPPGSAGSRGGPVPLVKYPPPVGEAGAVPAPPPPAGSGRNAASSSHTSGGARQEERSLNSTDFSRTPRGNLQPSGSSDAPRNSALSSSGGGGQQLGGGPPPIVPITARDKLMQPNGSLSPTEQQRRALAKQLHDELRKKNACVVANCAWCETTAS